MNEELLKALRTFAVPIGLILVFFIMVPRTCARRHAEEQPAPAPVAAAAAPTTEGGGLRISGSSQPAAAKTESYPDGLDEARIQYLVEINNEFSQPYIVNVPKKWEPGDVLSALAAAKYVEKAADGSVTITRDGLMSLELRDEGDKWTLAVAKRVFDKVTHLSRIDDDKYDVTISWRYQPTPVGAKLGVKDNLRASIGHFVGAGREWSLSNWVTSPAQ